MEKAQIRIIRSKRKTVALEIRPDLSVLVRAPYWMADWQIRKFVDENQIGCMPISGKWNKNKNWKLHARKPHL